MELTFEEQRLANAIDAMDKLRVLADMDGDLVRKAEIEGWFRANAAVIRPLRDKLEADEFDRK